MEPDLSFLSADSLLPVTVLPVTIEEVIAKATELVSAAENVEGVARLSAPELLDMALDYLIATIVCYGAHGASRVVIDSDFITEAVETIGVGLAVADYMSQQEGGDDSETEDGELIDDDETD